MLVRKRRELSLQVISYTGFTQTGSRARYCGWHNLFQSEAESRSYLVTGASVPLPLLSTTSLVALVPPVSVARTWAGDSLNLARKVCHEAVKPFVG